MLCGAYYMCRAAGFAPSASRFRLHRAIQPFRRAFPSFKIAFFRPLFFRKINARLLQTFLSKPPPESRAAPKSPANFASRCRRRQLLLPRLARDLLPHTMWLHWEHRHSPTSSMIIAYVFTGFEWMPIFSNMLNSIKMSALDGLCIEIMQPERFISTNKQIC